MARNLIGTGADQVSVNGMLGELAFQTKENVNFTGGTGKLSKLDIDAISTQLNVSAVDVFVYDTSKDSDGGAWRKRCAHTSWYNETLNTTIRGARKEFPAVAVIVTTSNSLIIYDGDDASLPLWMSFVQAGTWPNNNIIGQVGSGTISVAALNGSIICGFSGDGVKIINMIADKTAFYWSSQYRTYVGNIAQRNAAAGWTDITTPYFAMASVFVNDVAATLIPGANIDPSTSLPAPTIAAGHASGISIIKPDFSVVNSGNTNGIAKVDFYNGDLYSILTAYDNLRINVKYSYLATAFFADYDLYYGNANSQATTNAATHNTNTGWNGTAVAGPAFGNVRGISLFSHSTPEVIASSTMVAYIATKYNTGWMPGDTRGAWLSDNSTATISFSNLISNGTFNSNTTGWSGGGLSWDSSGRAKVTNSALYGGISQTVSGLTIGKQYMLKATVDCSAVNMDVRIQMSGIGVMHSTGSTGASSGVVNIWDTFTAVSTDHTVQIIPYGANYASTFYVDNVELYEVEQDRSVNRQALQVVGSVTKTPVASNADLVAYGGFGANTAWLTQPYNPSLQFGTGDFTIQYWINDPDTSLDTRHIFIGNDSTSNGETAEGFCIGTYAGGIRFLGATGAVPTGIIYPQNVWSHVCVVRTNGILYLYINKILRYSSAFALSVNSSKGTTIGNRGYTPNYGTAARFALMRVSATAISAEQIAKIYEDEKQLFQENAKATLYGSSDSISALAYDQDTQLLHAGTSSGRSVFQMLRRVDNTTTAVTSTISAANSLVVEQ